MVGMVPRVVTESFSLTKVDGWDGVVGGRQTGHPQKSFPGSARRKNVNIQGSTGTVILDTKPHGER